MENVPTSTDDDELDDLIQKAELEHWETLSQQQVKLNKRRSNGEFFLMIRLMQFVILALPIFALLFSDTIEITDGFWSRYMPIVGIVVGVELLLRLLGLVGVYIPAKKLRKLEKELLAETRASAERILTAELTPELLAATVFKVGQFPVNGLCDIRTETTTQFGEVVMKVRPSVRGTTYATEFGQDVFDDYLRMFNSMVSQADRLIEMSGGN